MTKAIEMKKGVVAEIAEKLQKSASCVVVDYKGLKVEEVTELSNKFREAGIDYKVYKNTLGLKLTRNAFLWINSKKPFVEPSAFVMKKPSGTPTILLPIDRIADCSV